MKKRLILFLLSFAFVFTVPIWAIECDGTLPGADQLEEYIERCKQNLTETQGQSQTLATAIVVLNSKINLAQGQINQTQGQIDGLDQEISILSVLLSDLDKSLDELSETYIARVRDSYKQRDLSPIRLFFSSDSFGQLITKLRYFSSVKTRDRLILQELEKARLDFDQQKLTKQNKQQEIEGLKTKLVGQKTALGGQKSQKQDLLVITQNDEQKFQALKTQAENELESILKSQFTGKREVKKGDAIGIMGSTGFSTGPHLHFGYYNLAENEAEKLFSNGLDWYMTRHIDPLSALESKQIFFEQTSCDDNVGSSITKTIGSGGFSWPMSNPRITQCYGHSPWSYYYPDNFHRGIDMSSVSGSSTIIKTIGDGVAYFYKGANSFGNNVRIFHPDGKMSIYMHLK